MSRVGKKPIELPKGVTVTLAGRTVNVKGPKGALTHELHPTIDLKIEGTNVTLAPKSKDDETAPQYHGLSRTLVANMVHGVTTGFSKRLKLVGVGYRAASAGKGLTLSLGFSHPINFDAPQGIELKVEAQTTIVVSGADKEQVGQVSATLRGFRPPEPYHGKGVRYEDEVIVTKVGKAAGKK